MIAVDIPETVIRGYVKAEEDRLNAQFREILEGALPQYFDRYGNFRGIEVGFSVPVCTKQGKRRTDSFKRFSFTVEEETLQQLDRIRTYTLLSMKTIAEIVILKEVLPGGATENAENRALYNKQGIQTDD